MSDAPPSLEELIKNGTLDPEKRYQSGLSIRDLYPKIDDEYCDCRCGKELTGRRTRWATDECTEEALKRFWIIKGDIRVIRKELYTREEGLCAICGEKQKRKGQWDADHIVPVSEAGGACELDNFRLLCKDCHKERHK